jgi:Holliday junction resolvase RusA-like endonuclease
MSIHWESSKEDFSMVITVNGNPTPLARHRSMMKFDRIVSFDSQTVEKKTFKKKIMSQLTCLNSIDYLLSKESYDVVIIFGMPYPQSKRKKNMPDLCDIPHVVKPDIDNLIKFVLDCGNGILWMDDKKINKLAARKVYVEEPKTIISIK